MTTERRSAALEVRAKGRRLEGYAALFNTEARVGDFTETIAAGAFAGSLSHDILALLDHDPTRVLARTKSKTLRLSEDTRGLAFDLDVPDTSHGRDVLALAERGDLGGMSFGFVVGKDGEQWHGNKRELRTVDLKEISVVSAWPAYEGTIVNARAKTDHDRHLRQSDEWMDACIERLLENGEAENEDDAREQCELEWQARAKMGTTASHFRLALARRYLELVPKRGL
jgi:Escherichia/Staphylococcus phage prohead protease